ncbi:MAG: glycosyltransferase family 2 protein, partial [Rhodobacter sp.]|nr:glycosyltransferase family 2 protein [Rhodobacter sp.]
VWLPGAVAGMAGLADETLNYDRASSVLSPDAEVAALVDKDLLVADAALIERAGAAFAQRPILPPERAAALAAPIMAQPSGRTLIVTCMKNEGPFILEWLAYHRMIGVDDFLIYTNDCDDGTDAMLDALQAKGLVQRRDNPFGDTGTKPQHAALQAAQSEDLVRNAGWIISMDVDEFINIHVGANRLDDLYAAIGDAGLISLTWRLFGNDDIHDFRDRPVIGQFTRCAPQLIRRPHQAWGFKTLFRNQGQWDGFGVHRPRGFRGGPVKWVNGSGKPMPKSMLRSGWRSGIDTYGYDLVTLNHYAVRSVESFLVKRDRGRVNHVARDQGEAYWFRMNNNDEPDFSIQRHMHGLDEALADLKSDPAIGALHDAAVAAHRARIRQLMAQPDYGALYDRLTGARMQRLSRMHRHFGMNVFLHGPSVVPDRVLEQDVPPDFFFNTAPPDAGAAD